MIATLAPRSHLAIGDRVRVVRGSQERHVGTVTEIHPPWQFPVRIDLDHIGVWYCKAHELERIDEREIRGAGPIAAADQDVLAGSPGAGVAATALQPTSDAAGAYQIVEIANLTRRQVRADVVIRMKDGSERRGVVVWSVKDDRRRAPED